MRAMVAAGGVVGVVGAMSGCTAGPPDPLPDAQALAAAIAAGDVADIWFAGRAALDVQAQLSELTAGMAPALVSVTATQASVEEATDGPRTARATLAYDWDLDGTGPQTERWTYDSDVRLVEADVDTEDGAEVGWLAAWSPTVVHPALTAESTLRLDRTQPARADIVGAGGQALVTGRPVERIGIDKVRVDEAGLRRSARALARAVGIEPTDYVTTVQQAGPEAFVEAIVLRAEEAEDVRGAVESIPGGRLISTELPLAPTREFARPLLGVVGEATAQVVDASAGAIAAGDVVGLSGLQRRYDEQLRGTPGFTVVATTEAGAAELHSTDPVAGSPLVLTLERETQQLADDLLSSVDPPSALVAVRPSTGELLAVASGPGGNGYSTATLGQYAPGSIFKIVSALALLRSDVEPDEIVSCPESVTVDGKAFTNYSDYPPAALGDIELRTAFAQSCNTAFVSQVDLVDWPAITGAAASLGLGPSADLGFDAFLGAVGEPASRVEQAAGLIGQGTVLMSPLGAAVMAASADVGPVTPVLVEQAVASSGESLTPSGDRPTVTSGENAQLMEMMRLTVTDGTAAVLADVPGPPVAAKTGTAEFGTAAPPDTHGWMVAVHEDVAAVVFVAEAESGSSTAGPILREFLTEMESASLSEPAAGSR
jgi:cell division protein FtsI/penicillin-binding protein 2